jgi:pseudaminic acid cytidylyltransferase
MHTVAIIPARGGSKRIPNKNIKLFAGKPIIAYSIEAAKESGLFDRIIVSTDSQEIVSVASSCGAETPFIRPKDLADDHTPTAPVLHHVLVSLRETGYEVDYFCCIYATAPFLKTEYIRHGYDMIRKSRVGSVFSVTSFGFPIFRALKIKEDGRLEMFWPAHELTRSQDLPKAYHDAGQFYWLEGKTFIGQPRLYTPEALPVILPRHLVQDIDTPEDWERAEIMFKSLSFVRS